MALRGPSGEETAPVRGPINVDEMAFAQDAVAKRMGIGLLPIARVKLGRGRNESPPLVRLLPEYSPDGAGLHLVSPSVRFHSAAVSALRDFLIEELVRVWNSL